MSVNIEPQFVGEHDDRRFYLHVSPKNRPVHAGLVFVAPWAEEANKTRRMVSMAARRFAQHGFASLLVDLAGTGESAGDFSSALWETWIKDIAEAHHWLSHRCGAPVGLWGLRLGGLLALEAAAHIEQTANMLLWQPVVSGKTHLTQFLRLKLAAEAFADASGQSKHGTAHWMAELEAGRAVEVAGYTLSGALAQSMAQAKLSPPEKFKGPIVWLEVSPSDPPALLPASQNTLKAFKDSPVQAQAVSGPAFWQSVEIELCPALIDTTLSALEGCA